MQVQERFKSGDQCPTNKRLVFKAYASGGKPRWVTRTKLEESRANQRALGRALYNSINNAKRRSWMAPVPPGFERKYKHGDRKDGLVFRYYFRSKDGPKECWVTEERFAKDKEYMRQYHKRVRLRKKRKSK